MNRKQLIQEIVPLLYDVGKKKTTSSYRIKHDLEHSIFENSRFYFTNSETIEALIEMGIPFSVGSPNYGFALKQKFNLTCVRNTITDERPIYMTKKEWETYNHTRKLIDNLITNLIKEDTSNDSQFTKLAKVVGYHS